MKQTISLLLIVSLLFVTLTGCKKSSATAAFGKMHYDLSGEPINLDPQTATDLPSLTVINNIMVGLFELDSSGGLVNGYAEKYELSEDGLVYTITLRSDGQWSNEAPLTAQDFAFAFERMLMPQTMSPYAANYYSIKNAKKVHMGKAKPSKLGVAAKDDRTLVFTLEKPNAHFLNLLAQTPAMPCNRAFFESTKGKYGLEAEAMLSNGAFSLSVWDHEQYVKLIKNDVFFDAPRVHLSGVTLWTNNTKTAASSQEQSSSFTGASDENTRTPQESFWAGKTHAIYVSGKEFYEKGSNKFHSERIENTMCGIVFNGQNKVLQNRDIRRAMSMVFDRAAYESLLPSFLAVSERVLPQGCVIYGKNYRDLAKQTQTVAFDEETAKKCYKRGLAQLNLREVNGLTLLTVEDDLVKSGDYFLNLSQRMQKVLHLYISIERVSKEEYDRRMAAGEYDLAVASVSAVGSAPNTLLEQFSARDNSQNAFAFAGAGYDALLAKAAAATDVEKVAAYDQQAEEYLLKNAYFIPMYSDSTYFVTALDSQGIAHNVYNGLVSFQHAEYVRD